MIWFAGLRGAIAFACAVDFPGPNKMPIEAATMVIVMVRYTLGGYVYEMHEMHLWA
jgi:hypothetical protein